MIGKKSWSDVQKDIAKQAVDNDEFRAEFLSNPEATLAKHLGIMAWPENIKVVVHENRVGELHLSIPSEELVSTSSSENIEDAKLLPIPSDMDMEISGTVEPTELPEPDDDEDDDVAQSLDIVIT